MAMDMRGSLNVSKFYKAGSNAPRFYGRCVINGVTYNLKGWDKQGKDGPWISLLFEPMCEQDDFEQCAPKKASLFSTPDEPQSLKKPKYSNKPYLTDDGELPDEPF